MSDHQPVGTLGKQVGRAKADLNDRLLPIIQAWEKEYGLYVRNIDVIHAYQIGEPPVAVSLGFDTVLAGQAV